MMNYLTNTRRLVLLALLLYLPTASFGQSITVGLTSTPYNINLGHYGDKSITQINLICTASSSSYHWEIDAPWQTTSGQMNSFTTTSNQIILVPKPGYSGCGGGSVSVTGGSSGGGGGGGTLRTAANTSTPEQATQTSFSYIVGFNQDLPYIQLSTVANDPNAIMTSLVNYAPTVTYSNWSLTPYFQPVSYLINNANQPGRIEVYGSTVSLTYNGMISTTVYVSGSANCAAYVGLGLVEHIIEDAGGPGEATCYNFDLEETDCYYTGPPKGGQERIASVFPNPATQSFQVKLISPIHNGANASLYSAKGDLVGSVENVNEKVTWDTSTLPPGTYFITIKSGSKTSTERILVK